MENRAIRNFLATNLQDTAYLAKGFARLLTELYQRDDQHDGIVVCLDGTLGAGKTTFVSAVCRNLGVRAEDISSPTFGLQNRYAGDLTIQHFDFYRLNSSDEVFEIGFEETVQEKGIHFVEWSEKFPECLPDQRIQIGIRSQSNVEREFTVTFLGDQHDTYSPYECFELWDQWVVRPQGPTA